MFLPEWFYWILLSTLLLFLLLSHLKTIIYKIRRRRWLMSHIRIWCFHLNHTASSDWIPVDSLDQNSKIITYKEKTYNYKPERVYRLPASFGLYAREPTMYVVENNTDPLDIPNLMKQMQSKKTPDELFAAVNTKVFIDMMKGIPSNPAIKWLLIAGGIIAVIYFIMSGIGAS